MSAASSVTRKHLFHLPEGVIYLDGNSLGPLPNAALVRMQEAMRHEWGDMLIGGWNKAGWMAQPARIGDRIGKLIGAPEGSVVLGDTLSVKVYQALAAALAMRPDRKVVLSDSGNFPTDLYMAEGLIATLGQGHRLEVVDPEDIAARIGPDVAALMLTEVDYRTGRRHDMAALTRAAQDAGAVAIWDLAHSAGALPIDLTAAGAEFAVGCTYKYLNGGPGAPAFIYVRPDLADTVMPALQGWLGHDAPFAFEPAYRPAQGIERMRVGTPPVLQMAALDAALDLWDGVAMEDVRAASIELSERFIAGVEAACPDLALASPRDPAMRGSQVSFRFEHGYEAMQALIAHGVIGDFRAPDIMRFGLTPLFLDTADIDAAVSVLTRVIGEDMWRDPAYAKRSKVT
ncbi:kynureninase [Roseivivax halotolerans]|jgi:kynureninase|uniref:Kynureninase n=1 Tax=Roseivivax halotolerans TaxID=93684 RepID=A0A1I5WMR2_9RHOB|nr:kynureninase [Roseivivax halotolerans]SFQ20877.1 kynureninase [Roseivivax halotolerans]